MLRLRSLLDAKVFQDGVPGPVSEAGGVVSNVIEEMLGSDGALCDITMGCFSEKRIEQKK